MRKRVWLMIMLFGVVAVSAAPRKASAQQKTIRVAVLDFSMPRNRELIQYGANINQIITNKIESGLLSLGSYKMVERTKIDSLQREFAMIRAGMIDPETSAKLRRVHGVDAVIYGTINEFSILGQRTDGNYKLSDLRAVLKVQVKMTNSTTWDLLITDEFIGQAPQGGESKAPEKAKSAANPNDTIVTGKSIWDAIKYKRMPTPSQPSRATRPDRQAEEEYCQQLTSEAVSNLVGSIVSRIQKSKKDEITQTREIENTISGVILRVTGNMVYITGIPSKVLQIGDKLQVKRVSTERDPGTGKMISFDEPVGEVEVLELQSTVVRGRFSSSTDAKPVKGDKVTN